MTGVENIPLSRTKILTLIVHPHSVKYLPLNLLQNAQETKHALLILKIFITYKLPKACQENSAIMNKLSFICKLVARSRPLISLMPRELVYGQSLWVC